MGKAFDATGLYETLIVQLAVSTQIVGALMLLMPRYEISRDAAGRNHLERPLLVSSDPA